MLLYPEKVNPCRTMCYEYSTTIIRTGINLENGLYIKDITILQNINHLFMNVFDLDRNRTGTPMFVPSYRKYSSR